MARQEGSEGAPQGKIRINMAFEIQEDTRIIGGKVDFHN